MDGIIPEILLQSITSIFSGIRQNVCLVVCWTICRGVLDVVLARVVKYLVQECIGVVYHSLGTRIGFLESRRPLGQERPPEIDLRLTGVRSSCSLVRACTVQRWQIQEQEVLVSGSKQVSDALIKHGVQLTAPKARVRYGCWLICLAVKDIVDADPDCYERLALI